MAQRHPTSSRRTDRTSQNAEAEDAFVARVYQASTWAQENTQTLILLLLILAAIIAGGVYYIDYRGQRTDQAVVQLEQIQQVANFGDQQQAKTQLADFITRFDGTLYANEARLILAELHLEDAEPELALTVLEDSDLTLGDPLGVQIAILEAKVLESTGDLEAAEALYLNVAEGTELGFQRIDALEDAARARELQGDHAGAAQLFQQIVDELEPGDQELPYYQMRLAEASTGAAG